MPTVSPSSSPQTSSAAADPVLDSLLEEFSRRVEAGEDLTIDGFAADHPDHADVLRRLLPTVRAMTRLAPTADGVPQSKLAVVLPPGGLDLGDYRLIREIGRGGMGIVYEAEQRSLGRRVAVKVLPFVSALDPRQLLRFRNEAHAAASLNHPHIVPVHAVGSEGNHHYYAMQLIDGPTLAQVLAELAGPAETASTQTASGGLAPASAEIEVSAAEPDHKSTVHSERLMSSGPVTSRGYVEAVLRLAIQAAEALEYAHQQGVIHRDVKPANLMLDGSGTLWITDFGLARRGPESDLTATGELLGTLRYMSPEQLAAQRGIVDQRTDIYSLAATAYEMLTLRPAFPQKDRTDLLKAIAADDPIPAGRLNRAVSRDLETVLLKSLEKDPARRYATAAEFAADLHRCLVGEAIQARRPSLRERLVRWSRRHAILTLATTIVLLVCTLTMGVAIALVAREQRATAAANLARQQKVTDALIGLHKIYLATGTLSSAERGVPFDWKHIEPVSQALYRASEEFVDEQSMDPRVLLHSAIILASFVPDGETPSDVLKRRTERIERALAVLSRLRQEDPWNPEYVNATILCQFILGDKTRADSAKLAQEVLKRPNNVKFDYGLVGIAIEQGQSGGDRVKTCESSRVAYDRCVENQKIPGCVPPPLLVPNPRLARARISLELAGYYSAKANLPHAEQCIREALADYSSLPDNTEAEQGALQARIELIGIHRRAGNQAAVDTGLKQLVEDAKKKISSLPGDPCTQLAADPGALAGSSPFRAHTIAGQLADIANSLTRNNRLGEAEGLYRMSHDIRVYACSRWRPTVRQWTALQRVALDFSRFLKRQGRVTDCGQVLRTVVEAGERLEKKAFVGRSWGDHTESYDPAFVQLYTDLLFATKDPQAAVWLEELRRLNRTIDVGTFCHSTLKLASLRTGAAERDLVNEAVAVARAYYNDATEKPGLPKPERARLLAIMLHKASLYETQEGNLSGAVEHLEALLKLMDGSSVTFFNQEPKVYVFGTLNNLAWILATAPDVSLRNLVRALDLARQATKTHPEEAGWQNTLAVVQYRCGMFDDAMKSLQTSMNLSKGGSSADWFFVAMIHWEQGRPNEAREWYSKAVDWMRTHAPQDAELQRFRQEAAYLLDIEDLTGDTRAS